VLKYSYLSPFTFVNLLVLLVYSILLSFCISLFYRFLEEKEVFLEVSSLKSKFGEKVGDSVSSIDRTKSEIERTSAQVPKPRNERIFARAHKKKDQSHM
jgi:hypothetical protein